MEKNIPCWQFKWIFQKITMNIQKEYSEMEQIFQWISNSSRNEDSIFKYSKRFKMSWIFIKIFIWIFIAILNGVEYIELWLFQPFMNIHMNIQVGTIPRCEQAMSIREPWANHEQIKSRIGESWAIQLNAVSKLNDNQKSKRFDRE